MTRRPAYAKVRDASTVSAPDPIVIYGVSRRSGTNFFARLLCCHVDCTEPAAPLREDHLLRDAHLLVRYAESASARWPHRWGDRRSARDSLLRHLGHGLLGFLVAGTDGRRVVTKTPSPKGLDLHPVLLPDVPALLLVRDGRSVTESLVRGFGFTYDRAIREWRAGARVILSFIDRHGDGLRIALVRYEDLLEDFEPTMSEVLEVAALDADRFDLHAARQLPIYGSSFVRTDEGNLTWEPVARSERFDPRRRYASWNLLRHERFAWLAGREQRALGYPLDDRAGPKALWALVNVMLDLLWPVVWLGDHLSSVAARTLRRYRRPADQSRSP